MKAKVESTSPMSKEQGFLNRAKKNDFCQVSQKMGKWKLKTEKYLMNQDIMKILFTL